MTKGNKRIEAPNEFIATLVFMIVFLMMFTPLAVIAFGFTGIQPALTHVFVGVSGLILFFILAAIGFYGEES